jgi:hypothetical protein
MALSGCSGEQAELTLSLARPPSAYLFHSHGIPIGWVLTLDVVLAERSGVDVALQGLEVTALDRGTQQVFGPLVYERTNLEQEGWTDLRARERRTLPVQLGRASAPPQGPIAVTIEVRGTDRDGRPVTARLDAEFPLTPFPP